MHSRRMKCVESEEKLTVRRGPMWNSVFPKNQFRKCFCEIWSSFFAPAFARDRSVEQWNRMFLEVFWVHLAASDRLEILRKWAGRVTAVKHVTTERRETEGSTASSDG
jgi:hypothetical protein